MAVALFNVRRISTGIKWVQYIECRVGSYKTYTIVKILLQKSNYWVVILPVIYIRVVMKSRNETEIKIFTE